MSRSSEVVYDSMHGDIPGFSDGNTANRDRFAVVPDSVSDEIPRQSSIVRGANNKLCRDVASLRRVSNSISVCGDCRVGVVDVGNWKTERASRKSNDLI